MSRNEWRLRVWRAGILAVLILGTACAPSDPAVKIEPSVSSIQENHTAASVSSEPVVKVAPPESSLQVNGTTRVPVTVENITNLIAYEMHLSFDANVLEVIELKDGGFIQADFVVQNIFDNTAGTIDYAVAQIEQPPANGNGTLFEIVFRAKAPGESPIRFRETQAAPAGVLLSDPNGVEIQVSFISGSLEVSK